MMPTVETGVGSRRVRPSYFIPLEKRLPPPPTPGATHVRRIYFVAKHFRRRRRRRLAASHTFFRSVWRPPRSDIRSVHTSGGEIVCGGVARAYLFFFRALVLVPAVSVSNGHSAAAVKSTEKRSNGRGMGRWGVGGVGRRSSEGAGKDRGTRARAHGESQPIKRRPERSRQKFVSSHPRRANAATTTRSSRHALRARRPRDARRRDDDVPCSHVAARSANAEDRNSGS